MSDLSARAKILRYAEENQPLLDPVCDPETGSIVDDPEAHLSGLLDAYAHELAEQQRSWDAEAEGYTDPQMAVYAVADLIDPEAQR